MQRILLILVVFLSLLLSSCLSPEEIADIAKSTPLSSPQAKITMEKICGSLDAMELEELAEVLRTIKIEKTTERPDDLRMAVLMYATTRISKILIEIYELRLMSEEERADLKNIFDPHPFLLLEVIAQVNAASSQLESEAQKETEAKENYRRKSVNLAYLSWICSTLFLEKNMPPKPPETPNPFRI